jgi:hypothetical protein
MLDSLIELGREYGPIGLIAGSTLLILLQAVQSLRTRLDNLTDKSLEREQAHNEDFTKLLQQNVEVMARLTGYIKAMKESVDRVENKVDDEN